MKDFTVIAYEKENYTFLKAAHDKNITFLVTKWLTTENRYAIFILPKR